MWSLLLFSCHEEIRNRSQTIGGILQSLISKFLLSFSAPWSAWSYTEIYFSFINMTRNLNSGDLRCLTWAFFLNFFCFFFRPRKYRKFNHPQALGPKFPAEKNKLANHCRVNSYKLSICHQLLHFMSQRAARLGTFKEDGSSTTVNWIMCLSTSLWVLECDVICFLIE